MKFYLSGSSLAISNAHLVTLPVPTSFDELKRLLLLLIFRFLNPQVWIVGLTIAIVASIETLCEADRMDVQEVY
jgi:hypothetical protein